MSLKTLEIDNKDRLPPAAPHADSAPWQVQRRWLPDWRSLAVLCAFTLMLLLLLYWLFGRDVRNWIQFGGGGALTDYLGAAKGQGAYNTGLYNADVSQDNANNAGMASIVAAIAYAY